ncbi:DNA internalization-related competence protein ComEC/Rec2 [gamma proteobacterium HTCC5015]|nr:DNA internalization-related competence protein ComEC/Rec2 [gamma proteobacterium HTCC5015]
MIARWRLLRSVSVFLLAFGVGAVVADNALSRYQSGLLPQAWEQRDFLLQGRISDIPQKTEFGYRFSLDVISVDSKSAQAALNDLKRIRLNWYRRSRDGQPPSQARPRAGDVWQFRVRLKRPHGFLNPGGFDYQRWLVSKGIQGKGYIRGEARRLEAGGRGVRERLWHSLSAFEGQAAALSAALVLGVRDRLDEDLQQAFIDTGTAHLLAISGLHVGMAAAMGFWLAKSALYMAIGGLTLARRRYPESKVVQRLSLSLAGVSPIVGYWLIAWLSAAAYASLAAWTLPTQRAFVMLSLLVLAQCLRRSASSLNAWAAALVALLLLQPMSVFSAGLWLSFAAVAWILIILSRLPRHWPRWQKTLAMQCVLPLCLWPITQLWFGQGAVLGALSNIVLIPLTALLILPLACLIGLLSWLWPAATQAILPLADEGVRALHGAMAWVADQPLAQASQAAIHWQQAALLSALLFFVLWHWRPLARSWTVAIRFLALLAGLAVLLEQPPSLEQGHYRVSQLDVGQGLATVVTTRHHTLVFDLGPRFPSGFNTAEAVVQPWLKHEGIGRVDRLIVSHGDSDHSGALKPFLEGVAVSAVYSGEVERLGAARMKRCRAGQRWQWDGVHFEVLWPNPERFARAGNNRSCVLRVQSPQGVSLITGDIESTVERQLLQQYPQLQADLLLVPHHGSESSSSERWVEAIRPRVAWFSAGYLNRFGLPAPSVVARYRKQGSRVFSSAVCGELRWSGFKSHDVGVRCYRQSQGQHWRQRLGLGVGSAF